MSSQNVEEVFFLEDIGSPPSGPPRTLTSSPVQGASTTPTETANSSRGSSPTASPHRSVVDIPSVGQGQASPIGNQTSAASTYLGAPAAPIPKQASTLLGTSLHKRPIHATPSAPSPLARASIVPHSSEDSSSNDSDVISDEEGDCMGATGGFRKAIEAQLEAHEASASAHKERFSLGSPRNQTLAERTNQTEHTGGGSHGGIFTPGSLLRGKRSDSGSSHSQTSNSSGAMSVPSHKDAGTASTSHAPVLEKGGSPLSYQAYPRPRAESFGSSMDPLMINTNLGGGIRKRSDSIGSASGRPSGANSVLGFSTTIPERRRPSDKGKGKEVWPGEAASPGSFGASVGSSSSMSSKASPRRERASLRASASLAGESPGKSRRFSEYSHSSEGRRLSISSSSGLSRSFLAGPFVPHAISTISPLNPLPSPWGNSGDDSKGTSRSAASDSPTSSSGAIRLNRVPSSVRLATDLLKSTPSMESSLVIPPLSASTSRQTSGDVRKHQDSDSAVTIPSTPVATRNATPEEIPLLHDVSIDLPSLPSAVTDAPEPDLLTGPARFTKTATRIRPSLPPPSAYTLLSDPLVESPPLPQGERTTAADRTSWQGTLSTAGVPTFSLVGRGSMAVPRDRSHSALESSTNQAHVGLGIDVSTSYGIKRSSEPFANDTAPVRGLPERFSDSAGHEWLNAEGDAARHANLIMQTRRAKLQKWRPASAEREDHGFGPSLISTPPRLGRTFSASGVGLSRPSASDSLSAWNFQETSSAPVRQGGSPTDSSVPRMGHPYPLGGFSLSAATDDLQERPSLLVPVSHTSRQGKTAMEKVPSTESTVNGIEWVDWLDEYKKYKEAKIRSEEETMPQTVSTDAFTPQGSAPQSSLLSSGDPSETVDGTSATTPLQSSGHPTKSLASESSLLSDDTPRPPHSAKMQGPPITKLSRALSHTGEVLHRTASKMDSKRLPSMPSSNPQNLYMRQASYSNKGSTKKAKALGSKIEGWWHSVKTNFQNPASANLPNPKILPFPAKGSAAAERDRPLRTKTPVLKVPSAPSSRRGSVMPLYTDVPAVPATFSEDLHQQTHVLKTATSHTNLARLNEDIALTHPAGNIFDAPSTVVPERTLGLRQISDPIHQHVEGERVQRLIPIQRAATGLEARRNQPALSLKLDQQMLRLPHHVQRQHSDGSIAASASGVSSSTGSREAIAFSQQTSSIGLTTGLQGWDQTPSPLQALNARQSHSIDIQSPPQTSAADFNKVSVQRHVKHRLTVAKESCDKDLQAIIAEITAYVEEHLQRERQGPSEIPLEDEDESGVLDTHQRAFGSVSSIGTDGGMAAGSEAGGPDRDSYSFPSAPYVTIPRRARSRQGSISLASSPLKIRETITGSTRPDPLSPGRRKSSMVPTNRTTRAAEIGSRFGRALELGGEPQPQSRSVSRSRSPMLPLCRPITDDNPDDSLVDGLQKIIAIATDVLDMTVSSLLSRPAECQAKVGDVITLGELWKEHPDWPGKEWYFQLLLAVAALSRVVGWWETEKGFWNWDDEDDIGQFTFVMKPVQEESQHATPVLHANVPPNDTSTSGTIATTATRFGSIENSQIVLPPPMAVDGPETARPVTDFPSRFEAIEDLQLQAERAKSVNIVLELGLDGDTIEWVNPAWQEVLGTDPMENETASVSAWMAPADVDVLCNAARQLEDDDSHTAQARFRLLRAQLSDDEDDGDREPGPTYLEFEGIGMLMRDRQTGNPTHTMWVVKPVMSSQPEDDAESETSSRSGHEDSQTAITLSTAGILSSQNLLCRICEREVPAWFFEKHNETCNEVHRLEADIADVNERLLDLRKSVGETRRSLEKPGSSATYQGMVIAPRPKTEPDYRHGQVALAVQKIHQAFLDQAYNILTEAYQISTPTVSEDMANTPIRYQTLLSPTSEERLSKIGRWQKPNTDQPALQLLFQDVDDLVRGKQRGVNRMRNTIVYSERVRQEWEDRVDRMLAIQEESSEGSQTSKADMPEETHEGADTSSTHAPADPVRTVDRHARLPITLGRLPSQSVATTLLESGDRPTMSYGPSSGDVNSDVQSNWPTSRRTSATRTPNEMPMSPRLPPIAPGRKNATSIKDFDIIKPISRGAFGSVYLAKKRTTGDYYAIKALKKQDMIVKNQITNVKAERTILMDQANSPYVAKLFWSFQSREYLYLVMEYLNGGDCAALIRTLGGLPEEWVRCYIAEVVLGLEYMHERGIVHRDLKPDNLLIDSKGHLKLTDFGLSRAGLLNRQLGGSRPSALRSTSAKRKRGSHKSTSLRTDSPLLNAMSDDSRSSTPDMTLPSSMGGFSQSYFSNRLGGVGSADESSGSESISGQFDKQLSAKGHENATPEGRKFVGTPDYLCPESILGFGTDAATVDWWALGVVMYEFLFGFPPFHDETPDKVFENIIARRISWYEDQMEISPEARDLMERLMCTDPLRRLGANGAAEIKSHPFFAGVNWDTIATIEANFVPDVTDPESTDYFDSRGALPQVFNEDDEEPKRNLATSSNPVQTGTLSAPAEIDASASTEDFGSFHYKNVHVLKEANDEQVRKLRKDSALQSESMLQGHIKDRRLSLAIGKKKRRHRLSMSDNGPPSPSTSTSSSASTPGIPQTPSCILSPNPRRPSENRLSRVKAMHGWDEGLTRRGSGSERPRGASTSEEPGETSVANVRRNAQAAQIGLGRASSAGNSPLSDTRKFSDGYTVPTSSRAVDVLIAEDNPISQKICETLLTRMGCRCVCVDDGAEALAATMGSIRFDVIICDLVMPNVSGEEVARMIRSTNGPNVNTPIIAATSYEHKQITTVLAETQRAASGAIFNAILAKPVTKRDLTDCLAKLGFITGNGKAEILPRAGYTRTTSGRSIVDPAPSEHEGEGKDDVQQSSSDETMRRPSSVDPVTETENMEHAPVGLPPIEEGKRV